MRSRRQANNGDVFPSLPVHHYAPEEVRVGRQGGIRFVPSTHIVNRVHSTHLTPPPSLFTGRRQCLVYVLTVLKRFLLLEYFSGTTIVICFDECLVLVC